MPKETMKQRTDRLNLYRMYSESGQTACEFSRERGVSSWKIRSAVKKTEAEGTRGIFQEVSLPEVSGGVSEYTVTLRNGRELRLPVHFTEKRVRQLVEILETC